MIALKATSADHIVKLRKSRLRKERQYAEVDNSNTFDSRSATGHVTTTAQRRITIPTGLGTSAIHLATYGAESASVGGVFHRLHRAFKFDQRSLRTGLQTVPARSERGTQTN